MKRQLFASDATDTALPPVGRPGRGRRRPLLLPCGAAMPSRPSSPSPTLPPLGCAAHPVPPRPADRGPGVPQAGRGALAETRDWWLAGGPRGLWRRSRSGRSTGGRPTARRAGRRCSSTSTRWSSPRWPGLVLGERMGVAGLLGLASAAAGVAVLLAEPLARGGGPEGRSRGPGLGAPLRGPDDRPEEDLPRDRADDPPVRPDGPGDAADPGR